MFKKHICLKTSDMAVKQNGAEGSRANKGEVNWAKK